MLGFARFCRLLDERNKARQVAAAEAAAAKAAEAAQSEASAGADALLPDSPTKTKEVRSSSGERSKMCKFPFWVTHEECCCVLGEIHRGVGELIVGILLFV